MVGSGTGIDPGSYVVFDLNGAYFATYSNASPDNLWHHYCLVVDNKNNNVSMYVDGILKGSKNNSAIINMGGTMNTALGILGARNTYNSSSTLTRNLNGYLTRMCVWDGALTNNEVIADYNRRMDCPINGENATLLNYYSMNTDSVGNLIDHISGQNMQPFGNVSVVSELPQ